MSDNTQQLLPPPENVPPNTVVQIQNKIFIDNFGFVDNKICKEPVDFSPETREVTFTDVAVVKIAKNSNDENNKYVYTPSIYNQHFCRQPYRQFSSNQWNLEQQDINCRKLWKYMHVGLKLRPIDEDQLCDGTMCIFFPDDPVPKDLKNFFKNENLFFSYVNIAPMYDVLFFPKMTDVSITNNANQFSIEDDSAMINFQTKNIDNLNKIYYHITAGQITTETIEAIAQVYENSCENDICQVQLNTYTRDQLFKVTYNKVIDIVDPIVNVQGNGIELSSKFCTKINIYNSETTISNFNIFGTGCDSKSAIFVQSKSMLLLHLNDIHIYDESKIFEVKESQIQNFELNNCTTNGIVKGFLNNNKKIIIEEKGCPLKGLDDYCFNERGCNVKETNWTDNGKEIHVFRLKPTPNIDGVKLDNYFNKGYRLQNEKTMTRFNGKREVCLVINNGFLEERYVETDKTCTKFFYDTKHDRLHEDGNPYFCFRAKDERRIIYGPCEGCDIGILTPRDIGSCPNKLYQKKKFNETHCDTDRGVRLCDPRCMIGQNFEDLTWTKIGVNFKSSCFDCSCIEETLYGHCKNREVINPGYNYGEGIILTEGNEYIGKIGSQLYLDRQYNLSVFYLFTLSEFIAISVAILSIIIFNIFRKST
tara:strand:- start:952 stop:2892 length:1941 start_codon:yes stop_codon:yes gene_type:complete